MKRLLPLALVLALAGCGTRQETITARHLTALRVAVLAPNPGQAPIYAAERRHFPEAGLAVKTLAPGTPTQSLSELAGGRADLAVSTAPALLEARDRGLHVVAVCALVTTPLSAAIWLPQSGISTPADFTRRPVGTLGLDYQHAFADTMARSSGARGGSVVFRETGPDPLGALERRRIAALVGGYSNQEGAELSVAARRPTVRPVNTAGVPAYDEFVLVARQQPNGDVIRSFIGALVRSTRDLQHHSAGALGALVQAERGVDPRAVRMGLNQTLPVLTPPAPHPYGYIDAARWRAFAAWMRASGLLAKPADLAAALTNRFLPGQGP